ncbi:glycosyltransferase family 92 protein [Yoonia litorea]|uniref:Glycosyltransferase family 92 n=1 Tax=Yoonia litorea TaxID=1123755 RepID=A0A1I6LFH6_9RHOB|nr:glycosyltransferase family 92 protein [Yoonia litorea]SFS02196.1 Glycosyltransferase family 92 [Yoonia litorea]
MKLFRRVPDLATRITVTPPEPRKDQADFAIVLIARNEGARLRDWLAFHAVAGLRHLILYDNGSTDDTVEIARSFSMIRTVVVPWVLDAAETKSQMRFHQQSLAYAHAICTCGAGFARMAFIDTDEYLVPTDALTIQDALDGLDHPNISLPWTMFGHNGHQSPPKDAAPFAFEERAKDTTRPLLNFKCIVDPCEVTMVNPHRFETRRHQDSTVNTAGMMSRNKARDARFATRDRLQLNHYYLMSVAEMEQKFSGPAVSGAKREQRKEAILKKAKLIESNAIKDTAARQFLARHGIMDSADLRAVK